MFNKRIEQELSTQKKSFLYRSPLIIISRKKELIHTQNGSYTNFSSNDYLGLGQNISLNKQLQTAIKKYGVATSSSRLITGNSATLEEAERVYGNYFGYENSIFFPSGYQANSALISTLFTNKDIIIYDKKIHSSIAKSLLLTKAKYYGYNHNSMSHLKKRIEQNNQEATIITESLFSMDGDLLPLENICNLKKQYKLNLIVDEAHSLGVLGKEGKGISTGTSNIVVGTFGKAFGFNGAFLLMPNSVKEYFINFSAPLIYTTALPPYFGPFAISILNKVSKMDKERDYVKELSNYTRTELLKSGFKITGDAHIVSIFIGNEDKALEISTRLKAEGILLCCCRYPTVGIGKAILRIGINAFIQKKHIDKLINKLKEYRL